MGRHICTPSGRLPSRLQVSTAHAEVEKQETLLEETFPKELQKVSEAEDRIQNTICDIEAERDPQVSCRRSAFRLCASHAFNNLS